MPIELPAKNYIAERWEPPFNFIPPFLEPFMCSCEEPDPIRYQSFIGDDYNEWRRKIYAVGKTIDERIASNVPLGSFCGTCDKPIGFSVVKAARICDECRGYYIPKPVKETYPIRYFLCAKCDSGPPSPFRRKR